MASITRKGRSKVVDKASVDQISSLLKDLPKKEKQEVLISEAIAGIADDIKAALAKGYGYDELSQILSDELSVSVSVWSLRRYLNVATKAPDKPKARRGRKPKAEAPAPAVAAPIEELTATVTVEPEAPAPEPVAESPASAPAKKRGTRTSAAKAPTEKKTGTRTKAAAAPKADGEVKTMTRKSRNTAPKSTGTRGRKKA
jgi:hypothetical protein